MNCSTQISLYLFSILLIQFCHGQFEYNRVVTFGDSTTDSGRAYRLSNGSWPPTPPFNKNGGFADDFLWNQILTKQLLANASLLDYSCGSATTDSRLAQGMMSRSPNLVLNYSIRSQVKSPGVRQQIEQYIDSTENTEIDFDRAIYIIWAGTNNYYFNPFLTPVQTVESILNSLNILIAFGGRHLVIINEPPFDRFPGFRNRSNTNSTKELYLQHNQILSQRFNESYSLMQSHLRIRLFDSYSFISKILDNYLMYGFENVDHCWDSMSSPTVQIVCRNITRRIFCDEYHLTSKMQMIFAEEFYRFITKT